MAESLEVESVTVVRGGTGILNGVSVSAPAGKTTAVLGPSGGGKTTLLRTITGLEIPTAGRVVLGGVDVTGVPPHRRGIGLMFQDQALFPHRNVGDNVAFGLRMAQRRRSAAEVAARVDDVLGLVGLDGYAGRPVGSLSGGEAQRVALARALAPSPAVLCLDEPLGSLDRVLHDRLVVDLRRLFTDLATTVVHVTHDQREALALADHLVVLGRGAVAQAGPPTQVWRQPASEEVARFLGQDLIVDLGLVMGEQSPPDDRAWQGAARTATRLVIRPDALALAGPGGPGMAATVRDVAFEGDRSVVVVDTATLGLLEVVTNVPPAVDTAVTVTIDLSATWPIRS